MRHEAGDHDGCCAPATEHPIILGQLNEEEKEAEHASTNEGTSYQGGGAIGKPVVHGKGDGAEYQANGRAKPSLTCDLAEERIEQEGYGETEERLFNEWCNKDAGEGLSGNAGLYRRKEHAESCAAAGNYDDTAEYQAKEELHQDVGWCDLCTGGISGLFEVAVDPLLAKENDDGAKADACELHAQAEGFPIKEVPEASEETEDCKETKESFCINLPAKDCVLDEVEYSHCILSI